MKFRMFGIVPLLIAALGALGPGALAAQTGTITGTVTDTGAIPISVAQVGVEGTTLSAVTQENGRFTIRNVPAGTHRVSVRRVGFNPHTRADVVVPAGGTVTVDIQLSISALRLQNMVVTATSDPIEGVKAPFSVGRITAEDIKAVPTTNSAAASIQGKVAGVNIIRGSGQPGEGVSVQLRTPVNFQRSNSPMYVVDGVILGSTFSGTTVDLEALDIESVEVVKGAAAASLYGSRAANGVIAITTSRGRDLVEGQTRISYSTEYGFSQAPTNVNVSRHHEFLVNEQGEYLDSLGRVVTSLAQRVLDPDRIQDNPYRQTYDNIGTFFRPGRFETHSVSFSGNTRATNFLVSLNQKHEQGSLENNDGFRQRSGRVNLDHHLRDNVSFQVSAFHSRNVQDPLSGSPFNSLLLFQPDVDLGKRGPDGQYLMQPDPLYETENPIWRQASRFGENRRARTLASADARFTPLNWLTVSTNLSYDRSDLNDEFYLPKGTPLSVTQETPATGQIDQSVTNTDALNASISAAFLQGFGDLTARLTTTALTEREKSLNVFARGTDFFVENVPDLSIAATRSVSSQLVEIRANGMLASLGLDYAGKYIIDGLVRRDGSSLFGPENRWNTYYRGSMAYRLAEEPWWPFGGSLNEFKLRYSIGTAGSRPGFSDQYETWTVNGSTGAVTKERLGNSNLKPSHTTEQEVGVDMIFKDRYSLELSYITQVTRDQITDVQLPATTGYQSQWQNTGIGEGNTIEATFQAQLYTRGEFSWGTTVVADRSRSRIREWSTRCFIDNLRNMCSGSDLAGMHGMRFVRRPDQLPAIHSTDAARANFQMNDDGFLVPVGAGASWQDRLWGTEVTVDGVKYPWGMPLIQQGPNGTPDGVFPIGNSNADVNVGWLNNIRYRGLYVHAQLHSQVGGGVYNFTKQRMYQLYRHGDVDQSGKPEVRKKPISYYQTVYNRAENTDYFVEDATYLKLRELAVQYRISKSSLTRLGLDRFAPAGVTFGIIGRNLWTLTDYTGWDPEVGSATQRLDNFDYPNTRTFTGRLAIEF